MKAKLTSDDLKALLEADLEDFPKYVWPLLNLANKFSQGTRPRVVGQMSDLIQEFEGTTLSEWKNWYGQKRPQSVDQATDKILSQIENFKRVLEGIDRAMVKRWVEDLVLVKTFIGLRFQEAILKFIAAQRKTDYRLASPDEESRGIDGVVGDKAITIKPSSYKTKKDELQESLPEDAELVYYRKLDKGKGIEIEFEDL